MDSVFQNVSLKLLAKYMEISTLGRGKQGSTTQAGPICPSNRAGQEAQANAPFMGDNGPHTAMYGGIVKVMHSSYQNDPLLYSKEVSNFLHLPEERIITMSSE